MQHSHSILAPRWRKIWRDLWFSKTRTALVVLAIAVGVFALGMVTSTRVMLSQDLQMSYQATDPASAILFMSLPFGDELVQTIRRIDGVVDVEGRRSIFVRLKVGPDEWRDMRLDIFQDYEDMRLNRIASEGGKWPPPKQTVLIERASIELARAKVGDTIVIETPNGKQRELQISGLVHDMNKEPAAFVGQTYGYITFDTLEWLGLPRNFNELHLLVDSQDKEEIKQIAQQVEEKVEKGGYTVFWTWVPEPGTHPANEILQPMLTILAVLGVLSLLLSGFLVVNTISAILAQQIRQIGVMKTIGARTGQIVCLYLAMVAVFGALSLLIAVPLGGLAAYGLTSYLAQMINFDLAGFRIPRNALILEVITGLIVPILAALWPVLAGTRITIREALNEYGLGKGGFGSNSFDQWLERVRGLSRPLLLSLRNTFRRKARLLLTLVTLILAGAIFIAVFTVRTSLLLTLDDFSSYWNYDVLLVFSRHYRLEQIEQEAQKVTNVVAAEGWGGTSANRKRPDGRDGPTFQVHAPPAESEMIQALLLEGRWLLPHDQNAIVLDTDILDNEPDIHVGDEITLSIYGREEKWHVVGIAKPTLSESGLRFGTAYINYPHYTKVTRFAGRANRLQVVITPQTPDTQLEAAIALEEHFNNLGLNVSSTRTTSDRRAAVLFQFNILIGFLSIMAVMLALVGALGLMGTMSMNVLERAREIGVMRAIGASNGAILQIFIIEGMLIGFLSWPVGVALAWPISWLMSNTMGAQFVGSPLVYEFSFIGAAFWLVAVLLLSAGASFIPAWNAARLTVREVLAYQ